MGDRPPPEPTPRELEVLRLICEGHSTKQVAGLLGISAKTAACHRMRLMEKAAVHDPINLLRWAILRGYVTIDPKPTTKPKVDPRHPPAGGRTKAGGDRAMLRKLTLALHRARKRFLDVSQELGEGAAGVPTKKTAPKGAVRQDSRKQEAFEEYQKARQKLEQYLSATTEGVESEEEEEVE